jgi:hypothetical protein
MSCGCSDRTTRTASSSARRLRQLAGWSTLVLECETHSRHHFQESRRITPRSRNPWRRASSVSPSLIDPLESIRNLDRGIVLNFGCAKHHASHRIGGTALDQTAACQGRSNWNGRRLRGLARGVDPNRDRAAGVNGYESLPSLSRPRRGSREKVRIFEDIEYSDILQRPLVPACPGWRYSRSRAPMWFATILLSE